MLNLLKINKHSSSPLYKQIYAQLDDAIENGIIKPGEKLPTELEICKKFNISRPVVRQAYGELLRKGIVQRKRGQGTFVQRIDNRSIFLHRILSFNQEMEVLGREAHTRVISVSNASYQKEKEVYGKLELRKDQRCLKIERIRYADGRPFLHIINYIPAAYFEGLEKFDLGKRSLYDILTNEYHISLVNSLRTINAGIVSKRVSKYLKTQEGAAVLLVECLTRDQNDRAVDYSVETIDGNSHRYEFWVQNSE